MEIEWLILADYAQVVGNKLYLMGGGWDVLTVNSRFPVQWQCAVAASFRVPWNETNQRHNVEIEIATDDGKTIAKGGGQVEVGRPPGRPPGQNQRAQFAVNMTLTLESQGTYAIIGRIEGQEEERVPFNVVPGPILLAKAEGPAQQDAG